MIKRKRYFIRILSVVLLCCTVLFSTAFSSDTYTAKEEEIISVSFPIQDGFSEIDESGNYSGYVYEYLMKIAQRTGWRYKFISYQATNENLQHGLDQVRDGEVDLIGSMVYIDALTQQYEYASVPYGEIYFVLLASDSNKTINERTLFNIPDLKIALIETAKNQNTLLEQYCREKGLSYQPVYADSASECSELVKTGAADAMIGKDVSEAKGFKTVIRFSAQPFYFASAKGNTELMQKISDIIREINEADPYYQIRLYEKYFKKASDYDISLTAQEYEYLYHADPIRTIVIKNLSPIQNYDVKTKRFSGIIIDILNKISLVSGLKFEYVAADNLYEAQSMLSENKADVICGIPYDYNTADTLNVLLTSSIFTMPVVRVDNKTDLGKHSEILVSSSIKIFDKQSNIKYIEDIGEIFKLIDSGEYKTAFVNGYLSQYYLENNSINNVTVTQTPYSNYDLCLGIHRGTDLRLMSILEQSIAKIDSSDIEDIIYQNTVYSHQMSFMDLIRKNPVEFAIPILAAFLIIIVLLLILFLKTKRMNKMISIEKRKYENISTLDQLTQTYNNETFKSMAKEYLSVKEPVPAGMLVVCDIDNFKMVNDTYGHLVGDEVIRALGRLLCMIFREQDIVGRLGGDEFVVLMRDVDDINTAEKYCMELLEKSRNINEKCMISLSIGGALFKGNISFDELFIKADNALYDVKNDGKNCFKIIS